MQYNVNSPKEYLEALEDDWRKEKLLAIRQLIFEVQPSLVEGIQYKMLSYGDNKGPIFHLNAQKNYIGIYFGDLKKIDPDGELLRGFDLGKGCIRVKKSIDLNASSLEVFIRRALEKWQAGEDIAC